MIIADQKATITDLEMIIADLESNLCSPAPTPGPTELCYGDDTKEEYLLSILTSITDEAILLDEDTPQGMAFDYLLDNDICGKTTIEQRYGLATLYFATNGLSWTNNEGWLGENQECEWYGVICDTNPRATDLVLATNNLDGKVPNEISTLFMLEKLDLSANSIRDTIPDGLSLLTRLEVLDLQKNLLEGPAFPNSITGLSTLESYRVNSNSLSGTVPSEIGNLQSLEELWAADNEVTGTLPTELGNLIRLKYFELQENKISGALPSEIGRIPLEDIRVYSNFLQNTIPSQLFSVTSLRSIRFEKNFLYGPLPSQIGLLTDLENLRLQENNLSGQIPSEIGRTTSLETLRLDNNFWVGTIPDVFQYFENLEFFDISNNLLTGSIPTTLFSIPAIRLVYMSNCSLSGAIPEEYANPPLLRDLWLDGNGITGTVPSISSGKLENLNELLLHDNFVSGSMPESICDLRFEDFLDDLWSDCGGLNPKIACDFPNCCNRCFEAEC